MKTITLGELLTPEQCEQARKIMLASKSDAEATKGLKDYFGTLRAELEQKGVLPDYLAYAVMYSWEQQTKASIRNN